MSQVHNTNGPTGAPFMHTRWENGALKLHYKKNAKGDSAPSISLGKPGFDWFTVTYSFNDGKLQVLYNEKVMFDKDITYWDYSGCHFKHGAYNQETTEGKHAVVYSRDLFLIHD